MADSSALPCINCLMSQGKARKLTYNNGAWECMTVGGCSGRFTDSYLRHVKPQIERLMIAMEIPRSEIIERGSQLEKAAERRAAKIVGTNKRPVKLPDE